MTTETRQGFRLPWSASHGDSENPPAPDDAIVAEEPGVAEDAAAEETQEPTMIETPAMSELVDAEPPASDQPAASPAAPARRATKFMADLSRAMRAAAENAHGETMARFEVEAKGVIDSIHAGATDETADLRRRADDDVAAIREWSKAEIARIREETDARISARKSGLDAEMAQHAATVEARVERVRAVVAAFETQMTAFFERLNAEEDPTRIATMAETMPDTPSLADVAASVATATDPQVDTSATVDAEPAVDLFGTPQAGDETAAPEAIDTADAVDTASVETFDFAAAEAEATFDGELEGDETLGEAESTDPAATTEVATNDLVLEPAPAADLASSRVIVSGLVSVANIANFKRSLARTLGVSTIAVASGPDGDFVFTVGHTLGTSLAASVQGMNGFDIEITGETDDAINVAARDRDATD